MRSRTILAFLAAGLTSFSVASMAAGEPIRVAFVYTGTPGDGGWTYQHNEGVRAVKHALGSRVRITRASTLDGATEEATYVIRQLAKKNDLIFTTSFGFMDPTLTVAKEFPRVRFEHASGFKSAPNMGNYFGAMEEARYLSGMVAGRATKSNTIGYVAAFPIPEVVRGLNAFALGARSVNPKAKIRVAWTFSWFYPELERTTASKLIDGGADVLAQHQDSPATGEIAQSRGKLWVGYDSDMRRFAPKAFLTAPVWDWGPYYVRRVRAALDGKWKPDSFYGDMRGGMIGLAPVSPLAPGDTAKRVAQKRAAILSGAFNPLSGPIRDQTGAMRVPAGKVMPLKDALGWSWLVDGVEGEIPKSG